MRTLKLRDRLSYDDFLTFDGPTGIPVAPEDTRGNFYLHLGLKESNYRHERLYAKMKEEAAVGMDRLFSSRDCLELHLVADESVQAPYSPLQMTEVAFQREIDHIYQTASRQTKGFYDITDTPDSRNWVIRWMLWRVVQAAQVRRTRASSSDVETVHSMLTTCSSAADYPSVRTDQLASPYSSPLSVVCCAGPVSPSDLVDDDRDDYEQRPRKMIKLNPDVTRKSPYRRSAFWDQVMNT